MAINEEITQAQQRAEQQIALMQDEYGSEKHVVKNLEREKEAYRQDLEDALQNNFELKTLNTALREDVQSAKSKYERLKHTYSRSLIKE